MTCSIDGIHQTLGTTATSTPVVTWFLSSILAFPKYQDSIFEENQRIKPVNFSQISPEYDFIIIGSGSAGSVVANRLSEESSWKILLVEAGVDESPISDVPLFADNIQKSSADYAFQPEYSRKSCLAMTDKRCSWPSGKSLGGSSVMGYMQYIRGNKNDYNMWDAKVNSGWCYDEVLPYFKKSEDNDNEEFLSTCYHSSGGLMSVSDPLSVTPFADAFVEAGKQMGYCVNDPNGAQQTGFSVTQVMMKDGKRCSIAKAYLRPARDRQNLHISFNTTVSKINIHPSTKRACSLNLIKDGKPLTVKASKEIILSSGTIGSPKILMLSGVGPAKHLASLKIKTVKNLPVGRNLQDQVSFGGLIFTTNETTPIKDERITKGRNFLGYAKSGSGLLSINKGAEASAFINTCKYKNKKDYPNIQLIFAPGSLLTDDGVQRRANGLADDFFNTVYAPNINKNSFTIYPVLLRPRSRGCIKLKSKDPSDTPIISTNYFRDYKDLVELREGIKFALKLTEQPALQAFNSKIYDIPYPACANFTFMSDRYIDCAIKHYTYTFFFSAGTCKMGPACDRHSVVDPSLRVIGIKNLRVIDASIMPSIISGNSNAPNIMIAEKGSDLIKKTWKHKAAECSSETHEEDGEEEEEE